MEEKSVDFIQLLIPDLDDKGSHWEKYCIGDEVELRDGIYLGAKGSSVVYQGVLVAAWNSPNQIIPHGPPINRDRMKGQLHLEDVVAHITMESLQEGCRKENLNWEDDCLPRIKTLIDFMVHQVEPIHLCMMAAAKLKRLIKEGKI